MTAVLAVLVALLLFAAALCLFAVVGLVVRDLRDGTWGDDIIDDEWRRFTREELGR